MSQQVFISYSRTDKEFVDHLKERLQGQFDVWIDQEKLQAGVDWRVGIDNAIRSSFAIVVILTPASADSKYVTYEWSYALGRGIPVIPIRITKGDLSVHPRISTDQYYDFSNPYREPWSTLIEHLEQYKQLYSSEGAAETAWKFIEQGRNQFKKSNYPNALEAFEEALKFASPGLKDDIYYEMGRIYMEMKDIDKAEEYFINTVQQNPKHVEALVDLGTLYRKKVDRLEPEDENKRETLLVRAQEKLRTAIEIKRDLLDQEGESVWGSLGGIYQRLNQFDKAIECYQEAINVQKTSYPFNNLGLLYMEKDQFDEMRDNFALVELFAQQKIRVNPADEWAHNDLFVALLINGKLIESKEAFRHIKVLSQKQALASLNKTLKRMVNKPTGFAPDIMEYIPLVVAEVDKILSNKQV